MSAQGLADQTFRDILEAFAAPVPTPGGGSAAALAAAAAAALVERCASMAAGPEFAHARVRARLLRHELVALADHDSTALAALVDAARSSAGGLREAAAAASRPPARLRRAAVEIGELAASLERDGPGAFRGEARSAKLLADAVARIAEVTLALNLALTARGS